MSTYPLQSKQTTQTIDNDSMMCDWFTDFHGIDFHEINFHQSIGHSTDLYPLTIVIGNDSITTDWFTDSHGITF